MILRLPCRHAGFFALTLLAACSDASQRLVESAPVELTQSDEAAAKVGNAAVAPALAGAAPVAQAPDVMLIHTGEARIEVDSLDTALARVQRMAAEAGGRIAASSVTTGDRRYREARLTLEVPAARFDAVVSGLSPLGEVESVNVSSVDVGEEFVDITARLAAARELERRLLEILRTRTGDLDDVLAVERELARVRSEIERMEGRLRFLRDRVDMSRLTLDLHEPVPLVAGSPGENVIGRALRQAWRNFVGLVATLIASLGFLLPAAVLLAVCVWMVRRLAARPAAA